MNTCQMIRAQRILCGVLVLFSAACWTDIPYTGPFETSNYAQPASSDAPGAIDPNRIPTDDIAGSPAGPNPSRKQSSEVRTNSEGLAESESNTNPAVTAFDPFLEDDLFSNAESMLQSTSQPVKEPSEAPTPAATESRNITPIAADVAPLEHDPTDVLELLETDEKTEPTSSEISSLDLPLDPEDEPREPNSRQAAWLLGTAACRATLEAQGTGNSARVTADWQEAAQMAEVLGIQLPSIPQPETSEPGSGPTKVILKVLLPLGRQLGRELMSQYDREHVALFEVAFKSTLLSAIYSQESPLVSSVAGAIQAGCEKAALPSDLWSPLLATLSERPHPEVVNEAISDFHAAVSSYLAG